MNKRDTKIMDKYSQENPWGLSTSVDLYDCDPDLIKDGEAIKEFVVKLCDLLQMRRYGDPVIIRFGDDPRVTGYSLSQMIQTSEVSGHFAEDTNSAYIDIFSCKSYPPYQAAQFTKKFFKAKRMRIHTHFRY